MASNVIGLVLKGEVDNSRTRNVVQDFQKAKVVYL